MKKIVLFLALAVGFNTGFAQTRKGTITEGGKKIKWTQTAAGIEYSDGKKATPSAENMDAKIAYKKAILIVAEPPKVEPPITGEKWETMQLVTGKNLHLGDLKDVNIKLAPGTYERIWFKLESAQNVKIDATGVFLKHSTVDLAKLDGFTLTGLTSKDHAFRPINIRGYSKNVTIKGCTFENVKDYVISYEDQTPWDKTDRTVNLNWTLEGNTFINTSQAFSGGGQIHDNGVNSLLKNFKFMGNTIKDCPTIGTAVWIGAVEGYEIAYNTIDRINYVFTDTGAVNGYHWGIFAMYGNGSLHDNKVSNHSGNVIRAWGVSFEGQVKNVDIYNNKVFNSHKYSAFEIQVPPYLDEIVKRIGLKYTNTKVYSNTAGQLNVSWDWQGQMLDTYFTGGTLEYYNNLGFDMRGSIKANDDMINYAGGAPEITKKQNNRYFDSWQKAVNNTSEMKSLHAGIGAQ